LFFSFNYFLSNWLQRFVIWKVAVLGTAIFRRKIKVSKRATTIDETKYKQFTI